MRGLAQVLAHADKAFPRAGDARLEAARLAIRQGRAQHRGELADAEHLAREIVAVAGPVEALNADIRCPASPPSRTLASG